jgi:phosphomannomutase
MENIFKITDKSGRKIRLTKEQWTHIRKKHPEIEDYELLKETIKKFDKVTNYNYDQTVHYYYKFFKHKQPPNRFLCIAVKYLNGTGYVITAYFVKKIK